jgi:hypothetical protein
VSTRRQQKTTHVIPEPKEKVLAAIRAASEPVKPAALAKLAGLTGPKVAVLLTDEVSSGAVFRWGTSYWHRDQESEARERLLANADGVLTDAKSTAKAGAAKPKIAGPAVKRALKRLVEEKRLHVVKKRVLNAAQLDEYLESEIGQLLRSFGREIPKDRIRTLFGKSESVEAVAEKIFDAMNRIAFSPGASVTFYRLRQQPELAEIPKAVFDRAALHLQSERKALLSVHDHASALPAEERERFVTDGLGTYYVSIYSR